MRFATFVAGGVERFGLVITHPATGEEWVFDPGRTEELLGLYASAPTAPYVVSRPRFLGPRPWPRDLAAFLALGQEGMSAAHRLQDFLLRFLQQSDACLLAGAGYPLAQVHLRAPIPRPRLYFGLVQNSPTFCRHNPSRTIVNIYPQGHARPQGTVVGPSEKIVVSPDTARFGWNPELGVIIGKGGRDIAIDQAHEHVAGLTITLDISSPYYHERFSELTPEPKDWVAEATASWMGKKTDTYCPMGPYLTTMDEIGNPYDLMIYTRQSGWQRDRSHTNSMLIGIERLVHWISTFLELYPGDVLHLGTMGVDGMRLTPEMTFGPDDYLEGEIERLGVLRMQVVRTTVDDWRPADDPSRTVHASPAARDLITSGRAEIAAPAAWSLDETRHFWTVYGNYRAATQVEGLIPSTCPRVLNGPARSLAPTGQPLRINHCAHTLQLGAEVAFVVGRLATRVPEDKAADYILGYIALASLLDTSFSAPLREPMTPQERNMPAVYGRWGQGYNVVSLPPVPLAPEAIRGRRLWLAVDGCGEASGNTDEYLALAPHILSFVSSQITLFPGDVVTLGRVANLLDIPAQQHLPEGTMLRAGVDGIGEVISPLIDARKSAR